MKPPNAWQQRFGALRRAKDRALLTSLERELAAAEMVRELTAMATKPTKPHYVLRNGAWRLA